MVLPIVFSKRSQIDSPWGDLALNEIVPLRALLVRESTVHTMATHAKTSRGPIDDRMTDDFCARPLIFATTTFAIADLV